MRRVLYGLGLAVGNVIGIIGVIVVGIVEQREASRREAQLLVRPGELLDWTPLDEA